MPATGAALLIGLAVLPGYLYLSLTKDLRRPSPKSALAELLEVLLVAVSTTGLSVLGLTLACPGAVRDTIVTAGSAVVDLSPGQVRGLAGMALLLALLSLALSWVLARFTRWRTKEQYAPSVMEATLGIRRDGHVPFVAVHLADGGMVEGVLHAYSLDDEQEHRAIALKRPLRYLPDRKTTEGSTSLNADHIIFFAEDIAQIHLCQAPDKGQSTPERKPRWGKLLG